MAGTMHLAAYYLGFALENHLFACGSFGFAQVASDRRSRTHALVVVVVVLASQVASDRPKRVYSSALRAVARALP